MLPDMAYGGDAERMMVTVSKGDVCDDRDVIIPIFASHHDQPRFHFGNAVYPAAHRMGFIASHASEEKGITFALAYSCYQCEIFIHA